MCNLDNLIIFQVYYFHLSISQNTPQESSTLPSKTCVAPNHNHYAKGNAGSPILCPPDARSQLIGKDSDAGKDWGQEEKGKTEGEMVGWHHRLNGYEFEQTPGESETQGSLVCCSSWDHKELTLLSDWTTTTTFFMVQITCPNLTSILTTGKPWLWLQAPLLAR